ncbi:SAM-dependent methyltransferase [Candidatus Poribacteria bacterium]|nr:SAM-dependent methyltransferase [Candidatus Poribacteria bacterium]
MNPYFLSISLLSGSIIAYEITLVRLFSIAQWHHFAYMIISLALLGFGASGTMISLARGWLMPRFHTVYTVSGLTYSICVSGCFALSQYVPFNPLTLVWQPSQMLSLFALYLILSLPFLFGAACIGMALLQFTEKVNRLYFFDLLGSGLGALGIIFIMYVVAPAHNLTVISAIGFGSVLIAPLPLSTSSWRGGRGVRWRWIIPIAGIAGAFIGTLLLKPISLKISPYKGLNSTLNFPDAEILSERYSPLGLLHLVRSQSIHAAPGLSLSSQHSIPPQLGLFTDADAMTAITNFDGDTTKLAYLDDTTSAVAYHLLVPLTPHPSRSEAGWGEGKGVRGGHVLVLGAGGGGDVLNALYHNAASIDAVELNPQVIELVEREHGDFAGHIYAPDSRYPVRVHIAEGRGFVRSTPKKYDLIQIALLDSVSASAAGTHALSESYLYTVEAIQEFFQHLAPNGIVSITRWLKTPPRDMIRLFATAVEALERIDGQVPAEQLALIRDWRTGTLLIKNGQFHPADQAAIRSFCRERSFDTEYYPQMPESEANRYHQLDEPIYFLAAKAILSDGREQFYRQYPFDIRPTTDNRPYFFQFLRIGSLIQMVRTIGRNAIPFIEWGYLLLIATLIQAILAGLVLILLPLFFWQRHLRKQTCKSANLQISDSANHSPIRAFAYFLCLGMGFMFIEMAFIQKFLLLLANPTYAVAVVLCAFLVFAGLGSLSSVKLGQVISVVEGTRGPGAQKNEDISRFTFHVLRFTFHASRLTHFFRRPIPVAIGALSLIACLYLLLLPPIFHRFLASPDPLKIIVSMGLIAPLAFFMGMPFPLGIDGLRRQNPNLIAWAWGINGYASVVSAILATCLAIAFGFNAVILLAIGVYLMGAYVVPHEGIAVKRYCR